MNDDKGVPSEFPLSLYSAICCRPDILEHGTRKIRSLNVASILKCLAPVFHPNLSKLLKPTSLFFSYNICQLVFVGAAWVVFQTGRPSVLTFSSFSPTIWHVLSCIVINTNLTFIVCRVSPMWDVMAPRFLRPTLIDWLVRAFECSTTMPPRHVRPHARCFLVEPMRISVGWACS